MNMQVRRCEYRDIEAMRDLYRQELNCQIRHDSMLRRGLADPYVIIVRGRVGGYGGVLNRYDAGRLTEFYTLPHLRNMALPMFRELLAVSQATHIEAQTNASLQLLLLYDCAHHITSESILFHDAFRTTLNCPDGAFRPAAAADHGSPDAAWVVESAGAIVASGGFLCHYNPPYADIHMTVVEAARRRGFGSYLVQEIKRVCYEAGKTPAARCNPTNIASRKTLEKAGLLPCGRILVGTVAP